MGVGGSETDDKDDDTGNDESDFLLRVLIPLNQNTAGRLTHVIECDETPGETDDHHGTELHEKTSTTDPVDHDHTAEEEKGVCD